jgi:hypothetical protein
MELAIATCEIRESRSKTIVITNALLVLILVALILVARPLYLHFVYGSYANRRETHREPKDAVQLALRRMQQGHSATAIARELRERFGSEESETVEEKK